MEKLPLDDFCRDSNSCKACRVDCPRLDALAAQQNMTDWLTATKAKPKEYAKVIKNYRKRKKAALYGPDGKRMSKTFAYSVLEAKDEIFGVEVYLGQLMYA